MDLSVTVPMGTGSVTFKNPVMSADGTFGNIVEYLDVFDITRFTHSTHVTPAERAAYGRFLESGWTDLVGPHVSGPDGFTYWDYYRQRFERNRGMRIDLVLGSPAVAARVTGARVDREERGGSDGHGKGASDHAPVIVDLDD